MDEPIVTPDVTPDITPDVTPSVTPDPAPVYFGADGVLNEGWQSTLPEGYRDEKSLATVKDTKVLARMFVDTKKMVGKDTVAIPTDASTEGEWQAFHRAGGRPETVADYNLGVPEGFPEEIKAQAFPEGRIEKWQERFFKGGVSKKAADAFIADFTQDMLADYQKIQQAKEFARTELLNGLTVDWGAALEQNKHLGNIAIDEGTSDNAEFKARLVKKFGDDPDFIRYSSNLGKKFSEGKPPGYAAIPTPSDYEEQIAALMADPLYTKGTQKQRMQIADKIMAIRKLKNPEPATT